MQDTYFDPSIIHEDEHLLVVDKPAGMTVHPGNMKGDEKTVLEYIRNKIHDPESERPGIVHRLDKDTSGVLIVAKDPETKEFLQQQFRQRTVKKHYIAGVNGIPDPDHARIDVPIGRNPKNPLKRAVRPGGKSAVTEYLVKTVLGDVSVFDVYPYTGRTHQIRVHLSYIGNPILGDKLYGSAHPGMHRHFLHAAELGVTHPASGEFVTYTADMPQELQWE